MLYKAASLKRVFVVIVIALACVLQAAGHGEAAFVRLQWDPVDSSTILGYKIHYGSASGVYDFHCDAGYATEFYAPFLEPGLTYYFSATCYSASGESDYSNEVAYTPSASDAVLDIADPEKTISGWWYDPGKPGSGMAVELQGATIFLVWYTYDEFTGEPTWISAHGAMTDPYRFDLEIQEWTGRPIDAQYEPPTSQQIGSMQFELVAENLAWIAWSIGDENGSFSVSKFLPAMSADYSESETISGWWRDPDYDGTGVFIESGGGVIFMGWYLYREDGSPMWYSAGGSFAEGSTLFQAPFEAWYEGQCIGCPYTEPTPSLTEGEAVLTIFNDQEAELEWQGLLLHLQRFQFDSAF